MTIPTWILEFPLQPLTILFLPAHLLPSSNHYIHIHIHIRIPMAAAAAYSSSIVNSVDDDVDTVISQATDLVALERIAALNTSSRLSDSSSSSLPIHLEARFQKLKSFPAGAHDNPPHPTAAINKYRSKSSSVLQSDDEPMKPFSAAEDGNRPAIGGEPEITNSPPKVIITGTTVPVDRESRDGFSSLSASPSPLPSFGESPSPLSSPPRRQTCCFGCSTSDASKSKSKKKNVKGGMKKELEDGRKWGKSSGEILTDYSTFSFKEQQRKLKKAMEEEEKASREAAKVVEWVKQASARMDVSGIDHELLGEDENYSSKEKNK